MILLRRLVTIVLVAILSLTTVFAFAQDEASTPQPVEPVTESFASGLGNPATMFDERGNPVSSFVVTAVDYDWDGYGEYEAPESGKMYVKVTVEHTNHGTRPLEVMPHTIMLVDNMGLLAQTTFINNDEITMETIAVEPGGVTVTHTLYSMWADSSPMMVLFQPMYNTYGFVHLPPEE